MVPVSTDDRAAGTPGDLALVAARFGVALRAAGVPADPGRCERFARAVTVARPPTLQGLYLCALATLVASQDHVETLRRVFLDVFGGPEDLAPGDRPAELPGGHPRTSQVSDLLREAAKAARAHGGQPEPGQPDDGLSQPPTDGRNQRRQLVPVDETTPEDEDAQASQHSLASAVERLSSTDFAELTPAELLMLSGLMRKLTLAVPLRRSRRPRSTPHGRQADLRATLRQARRTGGHPLRLARQAPLLEPRRLIVLCDISGSMEPYARAMLQLLYCAAGAAAPPG